MTARNPKHVNVLKGKDMTRFVDVDNSHAAPLDTESDHPQEEAAANATNLAKATFDSEKFTYQSMEESLEEEQEEELESD